MRCDQCRFWRPDAYPDHVGFGHCAGVRERYEIADSAALDPDIFPSTGDADHPHERLHKREAAVQSARAYVGQPIGAEEYCAGLFTKADFFCALFQKRD